MKQSQKKNLILCILATFFLTTPTQPSFDCFCFCECWKALFSSFKKQTARQSAAEQQAPIITANPFQVFEEEMNVQRVAGSPEQQSLPDGNYRQITFSYLQQAQNYVPSPNAQRPVAIGCIDTQLPVPANSLNNLHTAATLPTQTSSASSFDSCTSPTEEVPKDK